jgi:hypothetical protein
VYHCCCGSDSREQCAIVTSAVAVYVCGYSSKDSNVGSKAVGVTVASSGVSLAFSRAVCHVVSTTTCCILAHSNNCTKQKWRCSNMQDYHKFAESSGITQT